MEQSRQNHTMTESQLVFVKPENKTDVSDEMNCAFELCKDADVGTWMQTEEVMELSKASEQVFVVQEFAGCAFERLKKLRMRVFGPRCVISCYESSEFLPNPNPTHPIFNLSMMGITVCCTSIDKSLRREVHDKVKTMGGKVNRELTSATTHLVASEVGSSKYKAACNWGQSVMLPTWVDQVWEDSQRENVRGDDARYKKFSCPIFKGINLTVSQLSAAERKEIQQVVEKNGGVYSGMLTVDVTTHVILKETKGDKYAVAKKKNIRCVNTRWVFDSVEKGFCMDDDLYSLDNVVTSEKNKASTPKRDNASARLFAQPSLMTADISSIGDCSVGPLINETMLTPEAIARLATVRSNRLARPNFDEGVSRTVEKLDISCIDSSIPFLDGCKIYVSGFSPVEMEKVRKLVNAGGATRFSQMNDSVSHVVLGDQIDERFKMPAEDGSGPHIVDSRWLMQSLKEGKPANESPFLCKGLNTSSSKSGISQLGGFAEAILNPLPRERVDIDRDSHNEATCNPDDATSAGFQDCVTGESIASTSVFHGLRFQFFGFDRLDQQSLKQLVTKHGGSVKTQENETVDYAVVPVQALEDLILDHAVVVTNFWLQHCIEEERLLDVSAHPLFSPIEADWDAKPLSGCVVSISQYAGTERDCIFHLAELLGARCQEYFVRKDNAKLKVVANTHLIAMDPEGSKYAGACKWGVPAVNFNWLLQCATAGTVVDVAPFVIGDATGLPLSKPVTKRIADLTSSFRKPQNVTTSSTRGLLESSPGPNNSTIGTPTVNRPTPGSLASTPPVNDEALQQIRERIRNEYCTPILTLNRLKELRTEEPSPMGNSSMDSPALDSSSKDPNDHRINIREAMASLDSPVGGTGQHKEIPIEKLFEQQVRKVLINDIENNRSIVPGRKVEDILAEAEDKNGPLFGLVIVVSKKLAHLQSELNRKASALGANVRWKYDKLCTHFIHQGKSNDASREFRAAKVDGKHIVSPEWLQACEDKHAKVDERVYPYTQNPHMRLEITTEPQNVATPNESKQKPTQTYPKKCSTRTPSGSSKKLPFCEISDANEKSLETAKQQIGEILASKNKRSVSNVHYHRFVNDNDQRPASLTDSSDSNKEAATSAITWDDPTARLERERMASHLAKDSQLPQNACIAFDDEQDASLMKSLQCAQQLRVSENSDSSDLEPELKILPIIMFSGPLTSRPNGISKLIDDLGGKVLSSHDKSSSFTHLLVTKPSRSLKYLSSLASGKWILHQSYLEGCDQQRCFVKEEDYEWGNPNASGVNGLLPEQDSLALAAYRWRVELGSLRKSLPKCLSAGIGAFQGWKVIVYASAGKEEGFRSLLQAGCAKFVKAKPPFADSDGATHFFVEMAIIGTSDINFESLVAAGVLCVLPEYIGAYLTNQEVDPQSYIVPEALRWLKRKNHNKRSSDDDSDGHSKRARADF